ncbi:MAG: zinc-ribbon domain-containing protein [Nitrososphaeraceae archaeon]
MPYVDYSVDSFCSNCGKPRPQDIIFCPVCHFRVRQIDSRNWLI